MTERTFTCGLDAVLWIIGGKWKALILWELHFETLRFSELRRAVTGISERMLILQLKELEAADVVRREVHQQVPPRVEYSLTEFGHSLVDAMTPLGEWGDRHQDHIEKLAAGQRPS